MLWTPAIHVWKYYFHSLGGALAALFSFKLAGGDEKDIPKPVTCVTWAAPFTGSNNFRIAYEVRTIYANGIKSKPIYP